MKGMAIVLDKARPRTLLIMLLVSVPVTLSSPRSGEILTVVLWTWSMRPGLKFNIVIACWLRTYLSPIIPDKKTVLLCGFMKAEYWPLTGFWIAKLMSDYVYWTQPQQGQSGQETPTLVSSTRPTNNWSYWHFLFSEAHQVKSSKNFPTNTVQNLNDNELISRRSVALQSEIMIVNPSLQFVCSYLAGRNEQREARIEQTEDSLCIVRPQSIMIEEKNIFV